MQSADEKPKTWTLTNVPNLYLHKGGKYYYRTRVGGKQIWECLDTNLKSVAEERLNQRRAVVKNYRKTTKGARVGNLTMGQAISAVLMQVENSTDIKPGTKRHRREGAKALQVSWPELKKMDPRRMRSAEIKEWSHRVRNVTIAHIPHQAKTAMRNSKGCSISKHNSMLDVLRMALDFAVENGAAFQNVARDPSINRPSSKPKDLVMPTRGDFVKLIGAMKEVGGNGKHATDLVELLAYSGARINEAKHLLWSDVDFERNTIHLRITKNGDARKVAMMGELKALLTKMKLDQAEATPDDNVLQVFEAQKTLDNSAKKAGIRRMTHHDFRHLFATTCIEAGIDIPTVARLLGHKDGGALAMKTYGHLRDEHAQRMIQRVSYSQSQTNSPTF